MESACKGYGTVNVDPADNVYCKDCHWHYIDHDYFFHEVDYCQPQFLSQKIHPVRGPYQEWESISRESCNIRNKNFNCKYYAKSEFWPNWVYKLKFW